MEEERKRILKMVQEGKLTVDEALVLLDELSKSAEGKKKKEEAIFEEFSGGVHFEEAKKDDGKFQASKEKIFEFIDVAVQKIKNFDLDLNFGKSVEISHIFQQGEASFDEVDIDIANGSVSLIPWDQKDVRIECEAKVYRADTKGEASARFLKDVFFSIEGDKLRFSTDQKWMKVDTSVYIPESEYDKIYVRMFNGSIEGKNLKAKTLYAKTANGKINMSDIISEYADVETANGKIDFRQSKIRELEAETINGSIKADGSFQRVDLQSFNGNINCTTVDGQLEELEAKTVTGSIKVYVPDDLRVEGELKSNLGNFNVSLDSVEILDEKSEVIQKYLRFRSLKQDGKIAKLYADTKTGSVTLKGF